MQTYLANALEETEQFPRRKYCLSCLRTSHNIPLPVNIGSCCETFMMKAGVVEERVSDVSKNVSL